MKRIIICTDGTWNKPGLTEDGKSIDTNVLKIFNLIAPADGNIEQRKVYFSGVGTGGFFDKFFGGITGSGLNEKIRTSYKYIVENYEPGDELYFFGFSRGAYTARSLVGLIRNIGILRSVDQLEKGLKLYRNRREHAKPDSKKMLEFRRKFSHSFLADSEREQERVNENGEQGLVSLNGRTPEQLENIKKDHLIVVKFIGIWDTVGALGIPSRHLLSVRQKKYSFHDITLSSTVDHAFHAIAIDEAREAFVPSIWEKSKNEKYGTNKYVQQMWFPGVHSNVGGGYPEMGLSDISFLWMMDKAMSSGLKLNFPPGIAPDPHGKLYDSRDKWYYKISKPINRSITLADGIVVQMAGLTVNPGLNLSYNEFVHKSVKDRIACRKCLYLPTNVWKVSLEDDINTLKRLYVP